MSARGLVGVRIGGAVVPLLPEQPVGVAEGDKPEEAFALIRCDACGATGAMAAPIAYKFYDDDHYGRLELWYESRHSGACAACAATFEIELSYTLTKYPATGRVELSLDQLEQAARKIRGGTLVLAAADVLAPAAAPAKPDAPVAPLPAAPPATAAPAAEDDEWLTCLDVDLGHDRFAVGRQDGTVIIAALATGAPQHCERLHRDRVSEVVFDGHLLWTAGFDGEVVAWDLALGAMRRRFDAGHGRVLALGMAGPDRLLTAGDDGHVRLWDKAGGAALQVLDEKRFGAAYSVAATAGWIAIGYRDGHSGFWEPSAAGAAAPWAYAGHLQSGGRVGSPVYAIAVSPAGSLVAFARDRRVTLYTPGTWSRVAELECDLACNDLQFDSKGEALVGACSERRVRLWQCKPADAPAQPPASGRGPVAHWDRFGDWFGAGMERGEWSQTLIYSGVRFAGDDRIIATSFDGTVQLFQRGGRRLSPHRIARFGGASGRGWTE